MSPSAFKKAEKAIADAGLDLVKIISSGGHYQIRGGALLVNWYPFSKKQTAYVSATQKGVQNADAQKVIQLATSAPDVNPEKVKRNGGRAQRAKRRMLKTHPFCHWCSAELTAETATLEHIIPLKRGGLDHHNNMALACEPCNQERGHNMPELEESSMTPKYLEDPEQFRRMWEVVDDPKAIREIMEQDQEAEDERELRKRREVL